MRVPPPERRVALNHRLGDTDVYPSAMILLRACTAVQPRSFKSCLEMERIVVKRILEEVQPRFHQAQRLSCWDPRNTCCEYVRKFSGRTSYCSASVVAKTLVLTGEVDHSLLKKYYSVYCVGRIRTIYCQNSGKVVGMKSLRHQHFG